MVRLSSVLCRIRYAKRQKYIKEKNSVYKINATSRPVNVMQRSGEIVDPLTYIKPPQKEWIAPSYLPDDFRLEKFRRPKTNKSSFPVWHVSSRCSLSAGIEQACLLTKSQLFKGLPPQITSLIDQYSINEQDERIKEAILLSQVWNNSKEKLPKHIDLKNLRWKFPALYGIPDTKSGHILLDSFIRLCQSMAGKFPELATDRRVFCKPPLETTYTFQGEVIEITGDNELIITGRHGLEPLGDEAMIEQSKEHQLLDMYPVLPTVDFHKVLRNEKTVIRQKGAFRTHALSCSFPHMTFRVNGGNRSAKAFQSYNIMSTFGVAVAEAKNRFGAVDNEDLETPITIININNTFNTFNFLVFQLNTLNFSDSNGVKNFVWSDREKLFSKIYCQPWLEPDKMYKPPTYMDYNPEVFKKFLALYLYDFAK